MHGYRSVLHVMDRDRGGSDSKPADFVWHGQGTTGRERRRTT